MVDIVSKRDGPRREDVAIRTFLNENRATIAQLQRCLTGDGAPRRPVIEAPSAAAVRAVGYRRGEEARETTPYLRFSPNGRVVIADFETGRQLHHLGDFRGTGVARRFVLALRQNGYFAPVEPELAERMADLDGFAVRDKSDETKLAAAIVESLRLRP